MVYIKDKAEIDIKTKKVVLARDGIYRYAGYELGLAGDETIYNVMRTTASVMKVADKVNELGSIPITIEHPKKFLDLSNDMNYKKGGVGNCYTDKTKDYNVVCGSIVSMSDEVKALLQKGQEVSLGSLAEIKKVENENYDFEMNITDVNHLAIVDRGRCGKSCSISDEITAKQLITEELEKMNDADKKEMMDNLLKMVNESLDTKLSAINDMIAEVSKKVSDSCKGKEEEVSDEELEAKKKEMSDSLEEQLNKATVEGFEKGSEHMKLSFNDALKFIQNGYATIEELIDRKPCELIDEKMMKMFGVEEIADSERKGYISIATSKKVNDKWTGWGSLKAEKPKEAKKPVSIL